MLAYISMNKVICWLPICECNAFYLYRSGTVCWHVIRVAFGHVILAALRHCAELNI